MEQVDYLHTVNGIGIFISPDMGQTVYFSIPVKEKVIIGHSFDSRDLLCQMETMHEYLVLAMSKKNIHLYKGIVPHLEEITDGKFPFIYEETFEYAKPSLGSSFSENTLKSPEKDKSVMVEIQMKEFIRQTDSACEKYVTDSIPLIISGDSKAISDYMEVSVNKGRVAGKVPGEYFDAFNRLAHLSYQIIEDKNRKEKEKLIAHARELVGKRLIAEGMEEVQKAALDGLGLNLLVEKDFANHAAGLNESIEISSIGNAVDLIIKSVMAKDGAITFVERNSLAEFHGIALLLRYNNR